MANASIIAGDNNHVNAGGICENIAARNTLSGMTASDRRKPREPWQLEECATLKRLFDAKKEELGLTQEKAAHALEITQGSLNNYLSGRNALNAKAAADIASLIGVKVDEFSTRLADEIRSMYTAVLPAPSSRTIEAATHGVAAFGVSSANSDDYAFVAQYTASLAAGGGSQNEHVELKGTLAFKKAWIKSKGLKAERLMVIYAEGDSMLPSINDGDVILLDQARRDPIDGELFGLKLPDGRDIVKRLRKDRRTNDWLITSDNQKYPPFSFSYDEGHDVLILGQVVWRGGDL